MKYLQRNVEIIGKFQVLFKDSTNTMIIWKMGFYAKFQGHISPITNAYFPELSTMAIIMIIPDGGITALNVFIFWENLVIFMCVKNSKGNIHEVSGNVSTCHWDIGTTLFLDLFKESHIELKVIWVSSG